MSHQLMLQINYSQLKRYFLLLLICAFCILTINSEIQQPAPKSAKSKPNAAPTSQTKKEKENLKPNHQDKSFQEDIPKPLKSEDEIGETFDDIMHNDFLHEFDDETADESEDVDEEEESEDTVDSLLHRMSEDTKNMEQQTINKVVDDVSNENSETNKQTDKIDQDKEKFTPTESPQKATESQQINQKEEINEDPYKGMSDEQYRAENLFLESVKILNTSRSNSPALKVAFQYLNEASELGHKKSTELLATGTLLGWGVAQNTGKALHLFKQLADSGSPRGQLGLGFLYATGLGGWNSSQAMALVYFTFGALGGDHFAQMMMGYRYWAGIGVEANCELALAYYKRVSEKVASSLSISGGAAIHRIRLVEEAEQAGRQADGTMLDQDLIQYYQFLADKGDINAQIGLGQLYFQGGRGVEINYEKALLYLKLAENAGNSNAMAYLGKMYLERGNPAVQASNKTAFEYFKRSAELGNSIGLSGLGTMYLHGRAVERDYAKALEYFSRAADQGWVEGQLQLAIMYSKGLGTRVNHKLALKYFNLAAQQGNILAFYNLAQMHATGTGVLRSCHTATELFKNVAERGRWSELIMDAHSAYKNHRFREALVKYLFLAELGYEVAQSNAAYILDQGVSDLSFDQWESFKRALLQWQRSASQGYTTARVKVGDYHYYGFGTERDYEVAAQHYRMASDQQRNPQAMFNLGYMHEQGLGMKRDFHLAKRFYDLAAESSTDAQVPVSLALAKLNVYFALDYFRDYHKLWNLFSSAVDPRYYFGPKWDIYLMTALLGLAIIIFFIIRGSHRP